MVDFFQLLVFPIVAIVLFAEIRDKPRMWTKDLIHVLAHRAKTYMIKQTFSVIFMIKLFNLMRKKSSLRDTTLLMLDRLNHCEC